MASTIQLRERDNIRAALTTLLTHLEPNLPPATHQEQARIRQLQLERHTYPSFEDARTLREFDGILDKLSTSGLHARKSEAALRWAAYQKEHAVSTEASRAQAFLADSGFGGRGGRGRGSRGGGSSSGSRDSRDTFNYSTANAMLRLLLLLSSSPTQVGTHC